MQGVSRVLSRAACERPPPARRQVHQHFEAQAGAPQGEGVHGLPRLGLQHKLSISIVFNQNISKDCLG